MRIISVPYLFVISLGNVDGIKHSSNRGGERLQRGSYSMFFSNLNVKQKPGLRSWFCTSFISNACRQAAALACVHPKGGCFHGSRVKY